MKNDLIYLYCITDSPPFPGQSIESHGLKSIKIDNLYTIIRYVKHSEFSEESLNRNLSDIHWVKTMGNEHQYIIKKVMEHNYVIPFKLGTVFTSEESLKKFITETSGSAEVKFL